MAAKSWDFGVRRELEMVDKKLHEMVKSRESVLTEAALHVIEAGGKRIRPAVTILTYKALGGTDSEKIVDIAAAFELIHSATLIHDDINDGGCTRRGRETVYKKFGLHDAIVAGDFLFVKAFGLAGVYDKMVVDTAADACAALAEGEILQYKFRHKKDLTVDTYLQVAERKTAQPIRAGAMVGAHLAGGSADHIQSLGSYGLDLGIAFQIVDDILDYTGDERKTGKMPGMDLKEGHLTLPSLLALKSSDDAKKCILDIIAQADPTADAVKECAALVVRSGAIEKAKGMCEYYGIEAIGHLGCLTDSEYSRGLRALVRAVVDRES